MTNKEAIEHLNNKLNIAYFTAEDNEALDMAIKALEERSAGKWLEVGKYQFECDQCHYDDCAVKTNYCPNCGTKMINPITLIDKLGPVFEQIAETATNFFEDETISGLLEEGEE